MTFTKFIYSCGVQIKNLYGYKLVRAAKQSEDVASSAAGTTQNSVNNLLRRKSKHLRDLLHI